MSASAARVTIDTLTETGNRARQTSGTQGTLFLKAVTFVKFRFIRFPAKHVIYNLSYSDYILENSFEFVLIQTRQLESLVINHLLVSVHLPENPFVYVLHQKLYVKPFVSDNLPLITTFMISHLNQFSIKRCSSNISDHPLKWTVLTHPENAHRRINCVHSLFFIFFEVQVPLESIKFRSLFVLQKMTGRKM